MKYDFLKNFARRIQNIAKYALLLSNSGQKNIWKTYGFNEEYQQLTVLLSTMLFVMEKSSRREFCIMDDVASFIDSINTQYIHHPMSYDDCWLLGDFIINTVLSNDGVPMSYQAFDYDSMEYKKVNISYVSNKIVYLENDVRRTSYELTDAGYDFLLGTLEVEDNMKLTLQEMIFRLHMEKQSYDKALDDIRQMFARMRGQVQRIQDAMHKIRRNALTYNIEDYDSIQQGTLDTINEIMKKLRGYRDSVKVRIQEILKFREDEVKIEEGNTLNDLKEIDKYLSMALDEYQLIMKNHYDLKFLYEEELQNISAMTMVQRYSLRTEIFDKVMQDVRVLDNIDYLLRPLFNKPMEKSLMLETVFQPQRRRATIEEGESVESIDFDEEAWEREQEARRRAKNKRYEDSLACILEMAVLKGRTSLSEICSLVQKGTVDKNVLIPSISVFKELIVELIRHGAIDISSLRQERAEFLLDESDTFSLTNTLLKVLDTNPSWQHITNLIVARLPGAEPVVFDDVSEDDGIAKRILCSDVAIKVVFGEKQ